MSTEVKGVLVKGPNQTTNEQLKFKEEEGGQREQRTQSARRPLQRTNTRHVRKKPPAYVKRRATTSGFNVEDEVNEDVNDRRRKNKYCLFVLLMVGRRGVL